MDPKIKSHIAESGLVPKDLRAREVTPTELAACRIDNANQQGYVIPYFDLNGMPIPFYRLRLFDHPHKYRQPLKTANHVYFPPNFFSTLARSKHKCIIITEGERKAAAGCKAGWPTVGLGGVDSWRSRTLILPGNTELSQMKKGKNKFLLARLPSGTPDVPVQTTILAEGMQDLIDITLERNLTIMLAYDTDLADTPYLKSPVQRAANYLGHELHQRGIDSLSIRHLILPPIEGLQGKTGLDDYILHMGEENFNELAQTTLDARQAFPRHPSPKAYLSNILNRGKLGRQEAISLAHNILVEMDCRGIRMKGKNDQAPFYFDNQTKSLMESRILCKGNEQLHETAFGAYLYKTYGVSAQDAAFLGRLAPMYTAEEPLDIVEPMQVLARTDENHIALQLSDSEMVIITDDEVQPIHICPNGHKGILFEQDHVNSLDTGRLLSEFQRQLKVCNESENPDKVYPHWKDVFDTINLEGKYSRDLGTLLYYISPWLHRWRDTQLPVEVICGEAGSGKSSIFMLRLGIMTGRPLLRNIPNELRDWHAGITSTGGLYVIDNVQFTNKELRQRLSDEICRIITEPDPHVEMRALFTTSKVASIPVRSTFAFTAIDQPFHNADFLQRSAIFTLEAIRSGNLKGDWVRDHLERLGGRESWLAHHLVVLHKFLVKAKTEWNTHQNATHRLGHYQQCLRLMSDVLDIPTGWLADELKRSTAEQISDSDWTLQGITDFVENAINIRTTTFQVRDICTWANMMDDYEKNALLTTPKRLAKYFKSHKNMLRTSCGIVPRDLKVHNRVTYDIVPNEKST